MNEKIDYICDIFDRMKKDKGKDRQVWTIHIDKVPQYMCLCYKTDDIAVLNLYDRCPHKHHHKHISLCRLASGSEADFIRGVQIHGEARK